MKCLLWTISFGLAAGLFVCGVAVLVSPAVLDSAMGQRIISGVPAGLFVFGGTVVGFVFYQRNNPTE